MNCLPTVHAGANQLYIYGFDPKSTDSAQRAFEKLTGCAIKRVQYPPKPYSGFMTVEMENEEDMKHALTFHLREIMPQQYVGISKKIPIPHRDQLLSDEARLIEQDMRRQNHMEREDTNNMSFRDALTEGPCGRPNVRAQGPQRKLSSTEKVRAFIDHWIVVADQLFPELRHTIRVLMNYAGKNIFGALVTLIFIFMTWRIACLLWRTLSVLRRLCF